MRRRRADAALVAERNRALDAVRAHEHDHGCSARRSPDGSSTCEARLDLVHAVWDLDAACERSRQNTPDDNQQQLSGMPDGQAPADRTAVVLVRDAGFPFAADAVRAYDVDSW